MAEHQLPFPVDPLEEGTRVVAINADNIYHGVVAERFDPDQGDFEYYVTHDDGGGSFWPRESLTPESDYRGEPT